jgi:hypothetical protein
LFLLHQFSDPDCGDCTCPGSALPGLPLAIHCAFCFVAGLGYTAAMSFLTVLILIALASSLVLTLDTSSRVLPAIAIALCVIELLARFDVIKATVSGVDLFLALGSGLALVGALIWLRVSTKLTVTSATLLVAVGALQIVARI